MFQLLLRTQINAPSELVMLTKELLTLSETVKIQTNVPSTIVMLQRDAKQFQNSFLKIAQLKELDVMVTIFASNYSHSDVSKFQLENASQRFILNAALKLVWLLRNNILHQLVTTEMHVQLIDVTKIPTNVFMKELNVLIMMYAQSTNATMEFVIILKRRIAMITTHALLTLVTHNWDANMHQFHAMITTLAQLTNVMQLTDVFIPQKFAMTITYALTMLVMQQRDVSSLQNVFVMTTNAPLIIA
jgi:hypothetical protein